MPNIPKGVARNGLAAKGLAAAARPGCPIKAAAAAAENIEKPGLVTFCSVCISHGTAPKHAEVPQKEEHCSGKGTFRWNNRKVAC